MIIMVRIIIIMIMIIMKIACNQQNMMYPGQATESPFPGRKAHPRPAVLAILYRGVQWEGGAVDGSSIL